MIPYMSLAQKFLAWLLWRINGWNPHDPEGCRLECVQHPEISKMVGIMVDYWYVRQAKALRERGQ